MSQSGVAMADTPNLIATASGEAQGAHDPEQLHKVAPEEALLTASTTTTTIPPTNGVGSVPPTSPSTMRATGTSIPSSAASKVEDGQNNTANATSTPPQILLSQQNHVERPGSATKGGGDHTANRATVRIGTADKGEDSVVNRSVTPPSQNIVRRSIDWNLDPNLFPRSLTPRGSRNSSKDRSQSKERAREHHKPSLSNIFHFKHQADSEDTGGTPGTTSEGKMFFGASHLPGTAAHRRKSYASTNAITDYEADLTSRDRTKQKEAVRRLLADRVRDDWEWKWPQPADGEGSQSAQNAYNAPAVEWKEREEWLSDYSDAEADSRTSTTKALEKTLSGGSKPSPFRFETPNEVGETIKKTLRDRKQRRKRRNKEEMEWNDGVRCFNERRDAWTGARHVPAPPRGPVVTRTISVSSGDGGSSTAIDNDEDEWEDSDTELPVPPPILPPTNAMRASIKPDAYGTIYDKVVIQQLTPSCPMNLTDVMRSLVQGWKRDGEWPPASIPIEPPKGKKKPRKLSVAGLFGLKDSKEPSSPGGIRRGIQRLMSLGGREHSGSSAPTTPALTAAGIPFGTANASSRSRIENQLIEEALSKPPQDTSRRPSNTLAPPTT